MTKQEQGICPICSSENISYGTIEVTDVGVFYPAWCQDCNATFEEHYDLSFAGHYNVQEDRE